MFGSFAIKMGLVAGSPKKDNPSKNICAKFERLLFFCPGLRSDTYS